MASCTSLAATKGKTMDNKSKELRVGYVRVSSVDQNTDRQLDGLELDRVYVDRASGKDTARPELQRLLNDAELLGALNATVYVHSMDRLARSLADLLGLVKTLTSKGLKVKFIKEGQLFTGEDDPMANLMLSMLGAVAEFERALIRERQREGIAKAQAKGVYKGRGAKLDAAQVEALKARVESRKVGESMELIAKEFNISRQTLYSYINS